MKRHRGRLDYSIRRLILLDFGLCHLPVLGHLGIKLLGDVHLTLQPVLLGIHALQDNAAVVIDSGGIGVIFACKFTVAGGYRKIDPDKILQGDSLLDRNAQVPNMSDVETSNPDT